MKINIALLKNNGETWNGSPYHDVDVPDNLLAKDIDHLPKRLGEIATDILKKQSIKKSYERIRDSAQEVQPIIGQECICPQGLGRVAAVDQSGWITVVTYVNDRSCNWPPNNVELIDPRKGATAQS